MHPEQKVTMPAPYIMGVVCRLRRAGDVMIPVKKKSNHFDRPSPDIVVPPVGPSIKCLSNKNKTPEIMIIKKAEMIFFLSFVFLISRNPI